MIKTFEEVWIDIIEALMENRVVLTLARAEENTVENIRDQGLRVRTAQGRTHLVKKEWVKAAWEELAGHGTLRANDIPGQGKRKSSFILALLAQLDYINYEKNPLKLFLNC